MKYSDIIQFPFAPYRCNIGWKHIPMWFEELKNIINLDPPYQRGYVWTEFQKTAFIEHRLKGGISGRDIYWNCEGWMRGQFDTPLEIVDGKQRLNAVMEFLDDKIKAFGYRYSQFEGLLPRHSELVFHINDLSNQYDIVKWYIDMNTGGSIHTENDLRPAYEMLERLK